MYAESTAKVGYQQFAAGIPMGTTRLRTPCRGVKTGENTVVQVE